jgi:hypothetical protein
VTLSELPFDEIWPFDFEFISRPGERPDVVCLVARELRSGRTLRLWHDQLGKAPHIARTAALCSFASLRMLNAPVIWR